MSVYSITIRTFLLSHYKTGNKFNGYGLENGEYIHPNKIINKTFNKLFENMELNQYVDENFKKEFCKRFYNREIGFEVISQFLLALESCLNNECFYLFKYKNTLRELDIKKAMQNTDMTNSGKTHNDAQNLNINETTPEKRRQILYPNKSGVIEYANALAENHSQDETTFLNNSIGSSGSPIFDSLQRFSSYDDLQEKIFTILDKKLFMMIF